MSAGQILIPPMGVKKRKCTRDNTFMFLVIQGLIRATIDEDVFLLSPGDMFQAPRGRHPVLNQKHWGYGCETLLLSCALPSNF
ncbi:hypothetical protein R3P38DRAFT_2995671 [Favolaschia claudopus]|uniref:Mif2/CENP-C cupin domain-containing protein n=1 Tax=Favolaschia claudopus TaxID=2862362 RepID=A0AAW0AQI9_9AGAR